MEWQRWFQLAIHWLTHTEGLLLLAVLGMVVGLWAFIEVSEDVMEGDTHQIDNWILTLLRDPDDLGKTRGPQWLAKAAEDITALGGVTVLTLITLIVTGHLLLQRMPGAALLVLCGAMGGAIMSTLLKNIFERDRPSVVPHLVEVSTASFPSGHAMMSAAVYLTLGALMARFTKGKKASIYFLGVACLLTFLIGMTRVFLGVHYPTDVLAGWSAGLVWAAMCWLIARFLQRSGNVEEAKAANE